jgi:hypothetical protein
MATIYQTFEPQSAMVPSSAYARQLPRVGTVSVIQLLAFAVNDIAYFNFDMVNYGTGNISVDIDWCAVNTSGAVKWEASIAAITPGDATAVGNKSVTGSPESTETTVSGTSYGIVRSTVVITTLDLVANRDLVCLKLRRVTSVGGGLSGDALVAKVTISYSNT